MTSKFKALTEPTPPLSSAGNTGALAQPSKPSRETGKTNTSTPTTKVLSRDTLRGGISEERVRVAASFLKAAFLLLRKAGLVKLYKVLSGDGTTVKEIRLVFDPSLWDETLSFRMLSDGVVHDNTVVEKDVKDS